MMSFFDYKMGSKKGYMEMQENFHLEILWSCPKPQQYTLLTLHVQILSGFKNWDIQDLTLRRCDKLKFCR